MDTLPLASFIRDIPDFPRPGIVFKDITPLLREPAALRQALDEMTARARRLGPELIVGIESRGFLFGAPLADRLGLGFVPVRKPGKLPFRSVRDEYALEYGNGVLEMHEDALGRHRVLIVDDLLATGGTAACTARLCERLGAEVAGFLFLVELTFLQGRAALGGRPVEALVAF
ncbi:MAG: adenine phosphoribosyltransferase [Myxococcales bacterium]|nr:adenine phosphoribosyltransferase [Myxococcales bacterium]